MGKRFGVGVVALAISAGVLVGIVIMVVFPTGQPMHSIPAGQWDVVNIQRMFDPMTGEPVYYVTAFPMQEIRIGEATDYAVVGGPRFMVIPRKAVVNVPYDDKFLEDPLTLTLTVEQGGTVRATGQLPIGF